MSFRPGNERRCRTISSFTIYLGGEPGVLIQVVCGSISSTSNNSGRRSSSGSIAAEYVIPTPRRMLSAQAAEPVDFQVVVHREHVEFPPKHDVKAGAALTATELAQHRSRHARQGIDVAAHFVGYCDRYGRPRLRSRPCRKMFSRRKRLGIERRFASLSPHRELSLHSQVQDVATGCAGGMAEPLCQRLESLLERP